MAKLFDTLAGRNSSGNYFSIGGIDFYADPLTIIEWVELTAIPPIVDEMGNHTRDLDAWSEYIASKLRSRIRDKTDPAIVTKGWVMEHLPSCMMHTLESVLVYGEMPEKK